MQLFTAPQKAQIQALYARVTRAARQRYGETTSFAGVNFATDETGQVISMQVNINIETPPDVDGTTIRYRKQVEVWE